jgi:hypothetical protein
MNKTIKASVDGENFGHVNVDQWTHNEENDCVYLASYVRNAHVSLWMSKDQARELAEALMKIAEAE